MFNILDSDIERTTVAMIIASENLSMRDIVKYGLITLGHAMDPQLYGFAENLPFHCWASLVLSTLAQGTGVEELIVVGTRALAQLKGPDSWYNRLCPVAATVEEEFYSSVSHVPRLFEPQYSPLSTGFLSACFANCYLLGLDPHSVMEDDALSPFMHDPPKRPAQGSQIENEPSGSNSRKARALPRQFSSPYLTNDMHPTPEQLTISHHPYLDVIPWPSFRARAIVASSNDPPLIDEGDLCLDLLNNGICCRSSNEVSLHGRGEGSPWDSRSWEAKPWFCRKWSMLTSGPDVRQSTEWWRSRV